MSKFNEIDMKHRPSVISTFSVVSVSDITDEALDVWRNLPDEVKTDPSLVSFKRKDILKRQESIDPLDEDEDDDIKPHSTTVHGHIA
jgi:hypothetical protein